MTTGSDIDFSISKESGHLVIAPRGDWTVHTIGRIEAKLRALEPMQSEAVLDLTELDNLDTAGAYILDRTLRNSGNIDLGMAVRGEHAMAMSLLEQVRRTCEVMRPGRVDRAPVQDWLSRIGTSAYVGLIEGVKTLAFVGETVSVCARIVLQPKRFRATATVSVMEEAGLDAVPIVMFLSFFVGMVIAFIGATILESFNSTELTVELVGFAILREFGVVLTAIILAGRTNLRRKGRLECVSVEQK